MSTHKQQYNKRHGQDKDKSNSLEDISKMSKVPMSVLNESFSRGKGAFKTNRKSVRPGITSPEQWAYGRIYSLVNQMEKGSKLNFDTDLAEKVKWYKKNK